MTDRLAEIKDQHPHSMCTPDNCSTNWLLSEVERLRGELREAGKKPDRVQIADGQIIKMQSDEIAMLRAVVKDTGAYLVKTEWETDNWKGFRAELRCRCCGAFKHENHYPRCFLAARIVAIRKAVGE